MPPTYRHRVRFHECDAQGFMFNSRYLELADVAMTEWLRGLGWTYPELVAAGADPSVVRAEVDFRRPVRFDEEVELHVACVHVGTSSFRLDTSFRRDGEEVATSHLVYVNLDPAAGTSVPLPAPVAEVFRAGLVRG